MSDLWSRVCARIDGYVDEMVQFQTELTAIPALGPESGGQGELEKARLARRWLDRINPDEVLEINAPDDRVESRIRPNLAALFKGSQPGRVWVLSHLDIVPPGELSLWDSAPFTLRRDGDRIFGRGVEDNQHGLVASYFATKALRDEGVVPVRNIGLIFVADEETGSHYGLSYVLNQRRDLFHPEDLIVVPDAGLPDGTMVEVAEKSMLWLKFTVSGKQCHASTPERGANTLRASARIIVGLDQVLPAAYPAVNDLFSPPGSTFEPTKKDANVPNVNTIPGEDVFYFDCRVLPPYRVDEVTALAEDTARKIAAEFGVSVKVEQTNKVQAPDATPPDAPVVAALSRAVSTVHGREARPMGIGGGTVAAMFREKGLPAAVWSTTLENAHAPNEHTLLSNMIADAKVFAHVFLNM